MSRTFFFIAFLALVALLTVEAAIPTDKMPRQHGLGFPPADAPGPHHNLYDCHFHGRGMPGGRRHGPFAHPPVEAGAPEESHHHRHFPGHPGEPGYFPGHPGEPGYFPGHPGEPGHFPGQYNHHNGGHFFGHGMPMQPAEAPYMPPPY